jgi:hypothetical protein
MLPTVRKLSRRTALALVGLIVAACGPTATNHAPTALVPTPPPAVTMASAGTGPSAATAATQPTTTTVTPSPTAVATSPTPVSTVAPLATETASPAAAPPTPSVPVGLQPGQLAPDFRFAGVDGKPVANADLRVQRRPYILFFFATW